MVTQIWANIGSGNGLLPDGTKPLPEPMSTHHSWGSAACTWEQFHKKCSTIHFVKWIRKIHFWYTSPRDKWVNIPFKISRRGSEAQEQINKEMFQLHLSDQQFHCPLRCAYIGGLTVHTTISRIRNKSRYFSIFKWFFFFVGVFKNKSALAQL